jgi:hypothetical protein
MNITNRSVILFLVLFALVPIGHAQHQVGMTATMGYYGWHSDNNLPITRGTNLTWYRGFGTSLSTQKKKSSSVRINVAYQHGTASGIMSYIESEAWLAQSEFLIDYDYAIATRKGPTYATGPSLIGLNHAIVSEDDNGSILIDDRFNGLAIGINGAQIVTKRLGSSDRISLLRIIQLRYARSVWFNPRNRDLSDYRIEYFQVQVSIGLGITR